MTCFNPVLEESARRITSVEKCSNLLVLEEAARRRGSCVELIEGESPKQNEGESSKQNEGNDKETSEGDSPKLTEDPDAKISAEETDEKEDGKEASQEGKDKVGNIPKLQRQRTRTRTISTDVYKDVEGRCS